jgi:hypothetical protein
MNLLRVFAATGMLLAAVGAASAGPITVTFEGVRPGTGTAGQYNWNSGGTTYAGLAYTPFGNGSASATHFVSFCIERTQTINSGTTYSGYTLSPYTGSTGTEYAVRAMWAEFRDDLDVGTAADRAAKSTAFQHAVWSLIDPTYLPALTANESVYLAAYLNSANWNSGLANLGLMSSANSQDQLVAMLGSPQATPEPGMLALGLLLAPAVYLRRRRAKG